MSSTPPRTSNNANTSSSTYRVNYSEYVADITGSPKATRKLATTGIGHHINPLNNPFPNRSNQPIQQTGGMPHYGGGTEKCARCSKSVYLAERKMGAGRAFHSSCFSCCTCKRKLDAATISEHKGEIYCKSCYTRQFGPHGLASGVAMSTEKSTTYENRTVRRSSYGSDLDLPAVTNNQTRPRANSSENILRDEHIAMKNDEFSRKPRYYDDLPEQNLSANKKNNGLDSNVDRKYQRSTSPIRIEKVTESNINNNPRRSSYVEENDRSKHIYEGEKLPYGSGTSAIIDIPVITYPKRSDATIDQIVIPVDTIRDNRRSRSPSTTSNDSYRRQSSRERQTDLTDDYSRLNINTDINRKYSSDNPVNTIVTENPAVTGIHYQSSSSSSYESKYRSTTATSNLNDRRSSSPPHDTQRSSVLNDFISKTNLVENTSPSTGNKYSALGFLVPNPGQRNNQNDDDDFEN